MKTILVPSDFSTCANAAVVVALDLAKRLKASIKFLHLMYSPLEWEDIPALRLHLYPELNAKRQEALDALQALVNQAQAQGIDAEYSLRFHRSNEDFAEHIQAQAADLVVMGSHGASGWRAFFTGSNAQRMLRYVPAPTLVVKYTQEGPLNLKHIAFASRFDEAQHSAFARLLPLIEVFEAKLHLLYVNLPYSFEESLETMARMQAFAAQYPQLDCFMHIHNARDEQKGLLDFCENYSIDLLALVTYGKSPLEQLFSPSLTEGVVNRSIFPVLALKTVD